MFNTMLVHWAVRRLNAPSETPLVFQVEVECLLSRCVGISAFEENESELVVRVVDQAFNIVAVLVLDHSLPILASDKFLSEPMKAFAQLGPLSRWSSISIGADSLYRCSP